jgi:hypothetical protein
MKLPGRLPDVDLQVLAAVLGTGSGWLWALAIVVPGLVRICRWGIPPITEMLWRIFAEKEATKRQAIAEWHQTERLRIAAALATKSPIADVLQELNGDGPMRPPTVMEPGGTSQTRWRSTHPLRDNRPRRGIPRPRATRETSTYIRVARGGEMKRQQPQHGSGLPHQAHQAWVQQAARAILDLLEEQLAVAHPELEARLSEEGVMIGSARVRFDPHIISEASRALRDLHAIEEIKHATKGGTLVSLLVPANRKQRATYVQRAARRKGMLYRRFFISIGRAIGRPGIPVGLRLCSQAPESSAPDNLTPRTWRTSPNPGVIGIRCGPAMVNECRRTSSPACPKVSVSLVNRR